MAASAALFNAAHAGVENQTTARAGGAAVDFDIDAVRRRDLIENGSAVAPQTRDRGARRDDAGRAPLRRNGEALQDAHGRLAATAASENAASSRAPAGCHKCAVCPKSPSLSASASSQISTTPVRAEDGVGPGDFVFEFAGAFFPRLNAAAPSGDADRPQRIARDRKCDG